MCALFCAPIYGLCAAICCQHINKKYAKHFVLLSMDCVLCAAICCQHINRKYAEHFVLSFVLLSMDFVQFAV